MRGGGVHGRGVWHGRGYVRGVRGACVAGGTHGGGACTVGGMHGRGVCMVGVHGIVGACSGKGMHGRGMHGGGAW